MPKLTPAATDFPDWSEVSAYGVNTLDRGSDVELHFHDCHEYWIIVEGRGTATSEGATHELGPGDMLLTRAGDSHSLRVHERIVAVYFYGVMPPGGRMGHLHEGVDPPRHEAQAPREEGRS